MKRRSFVLSAAGAAAASALPIGGWAADQDGPPKQVTRWTFQPAFDSSDAGWGRGLIPWAKAVEEATQGTVKIRVEPAGALVSASEAFAACGQGLSAGYAGWATVYGGEMPEGFLAYGLAMGARNTREAWDILWGNPAYRIGEIVQEAARTRNLYWAGWTNQGPNIMVTKFPVRKLEDLKGKKMRAGGPQALFHKAMGGSPVSMNAGDIYTAIRLGTIDGTYWDAGGITDMHFEEVTRYAIMPGWNPAQHQEIFVNLDKWKALTPWQRKQIEGIFEKTYFLTSQMHADNVEVALKKFAAAGGEVITLKDQEVARMRQVSIEKIWPEVAKMSSGNAKGVELWKKYVEQQKS